METKEILENLEIFKKQFEKEKINISFDDFNKFCEVEFYFLNQQTPYLKSNFYSTIYNILIENVKKILQNLDYFVNLKPTNPIMSSDFESIKDDSKLILELYFKIFIIYKKLLNLYYNQKSNSCEILDFLKKVSKYIEENNKLIDKLLSKNIKNLEENLKELKKEKKEEVESSIFH